MHWINCFASAVTWQGYSFYFMFHAVLQRSFASCNKYYPFLFICYFCLSLVTESMYHFSTAAVCIYHKYLIVAHLISIHTSKKYKPVI